MSIESALNDVALFHKASNIIDLTGYGTAATPRLRAPKLRKRLIKEEYKELKEARKNGDMAGVADAYADLIYVILGSALMQIGKHRFARVWAEVQRSNMAKVDEATGKVVMRPDGKVLKPDGWTPPNIDMILAGDEVGSASPREEMAFAVREMKATLANLSTELAVTPESVLCARSALEAIDGAMGEMLSALETGAL